MAVDCLDQCLLCDGRMCSVVFYTYLMGLEIAFSSCPLSKVGCRLGVQTDRNPWSCDDWKGHSSEDQCFLSISPQKTIIHFAITAPPIWAINALPIEVINVPRILNHEYPIHLSHKFHIPISQYILTSQFMYVWIMNIDVPTHNLWNCNS